MSMNSEITAGGKARILTNIMSFLRNQEKMKENQFCCRTMKCFWSSGRCTCFGSIFLAKEKRLITQINHS